MATWIPRSTAPVPGTWPYAWNAYTKGQCTWYVFWRVQENGYSEPCYNNRSKKVEGYTHAKLWPENFKEPWEVHYISSDPSYVPVPGDILVFDGNYGHVAVIEIVEEPGKTYWVSDYNRVAEETFDFTKWNVGEILHGYINTGKPKAYLHWPYQEVQPVPENPNVDQVYCNDIDLRVRIAPSTNAKIICHMVPGFFNVLDTQVGSGYTWYEVADSLWCADIGWVDEKGIRFIPGNNNDILDDLRKENAELKAAMKQIADIANKYIG